MDMQSYAHRAWKYCKHYSTHITRYYMCRKWKKKFNVCVGSIRYLRFTVDTTQQCKLFYPTNIVRYLYLLIRCFHHFRCFHCFFMLFSSFQSFSILPSVFSLSSCMFFHLFSSNISSGLNFHVHIIQHITTWTYKWY